MAQHAASVAQATDDGDLTQVNHVPGEICLVIEDRAFRWRRVTDAPELERYGQSLYAAALTHMNRVVRALRTPVPMGTASTSDNAATLDPMGRSPFERDLTPTDGFRDYFGLNTPNEAVLRPLPGRRQLPRPWILLPRQRRLVMLAFVSVGPAALMVGDQEGDPARTRYRAQSEHQRRIREFVKLLNWRALPQERIPLLGRVTIRAATPNWLTVPTHSHGSPGTRPERVTPVEIEHLSGDVRGKFTFEFVDSTLAQAAKRGGRDAVAASRRLLTQQQLSTLIERMRLPATTSSEAVVVAVLDTMPTGAAIAERAAATPENALLADVATEVARPGGHVVLVNDGATTPFGHVAGFRPNLRNYLSQANVTSLADHGLFVAGIIRDIAPRAEVRLIRVLDDGGVGDVATLFQVMQQLPSQVGRDARLIINLSLVADLPTADELLAQWFPETYRTRAAFRRHWKVVSAMLALTHLCLQATLDWLSNSDVLIVAAAGNEGYDPANRPEPLYPAAYDTVLGVAAVTRAKQPSKFSNRGDMRIFGNGVAVYGGQGVASRVGELPEVPNPGRDGWRDAVAGIFSATTIPLAPALDAKNETGWVWWSGTSFAAPIVSAIAANILLDPPTRLLSAPDLMQTIRALATIPEQELESAGPFDCSAIFARQVWQPLPEQDQTASAKR